MLPIQNAAHLLLSFSTVTSDNLKFEKSPRISASVFSDTSAPFLVSSGFLVVPLTFSVVSASFVTLWPLADDVLSFFDFFFSLTTLSSDMSVISSDLSAFVLSFLDFFFSLISVASSLSPFSFSPFSASSGFFLDFFFSLVTVASSFSSLFVTLGSFLDFFLSSYNTK